MHTGDVKAASRASSSFLPDRTVQALCVAVAALFASVGMGLYLKAPWATALWPWPDVGMSYVFLASIAAAIAAPPLWIGMTREYAAFSGIGINTMVVNGGAAAYLSWRSQRFDESLAGPLAVVMSSFVLGAVLFAWSRRLTTRDQREMPAIVRRAFFLFAAILVLVGGALALQVERVFPWNLQPQSSTLFGLIFLGASTYFLHASSRRRWPFAAPVLWSFLAYDLVLFMPYLGMLRGFTDGSSLADEYGGATAGAGGINVPSLVIYLTVLAASTVLALYTFLVHRKTRLIGGLASRH